MKAARLKSRTTIFSSIALVALALCTQSFAGSAQWSSSPGNNDWNTATNWAPMTVPNGSADVATFALSNSTNVSISANTIVHGITFTAAATTPYTITANPSLSLTFNGTGITNNSGTTQNFVTITDGAGNFGEVAFANSATAGSSTAFTNNAATVSGVPGGFTQFLNSSSAGSATIINNAGTVRDAGGGFTGFSNTSSAGSAIINNNGPSVVSHALWGETDFTDASSAGNATINNKGAAVGGLGGQTLFFNTSSAGNATINTDGGQGQAPGVTVEGGGVSFSDSSTAGHGTFVTNGGAVDFASGGFIQFSNTSTAANGVFINNGGLIGQAQGANISFFDTSTAGHGIFTTNGTINPGLGGLEATMYFFNRSTAGNGTFITNGGELVGGAMIFFDSSTAGNGVFTNNGTTVASFGGGGVSFTDTSTAGNGIFINNGGPVSGAAGGITSFGGNSTAGNATLIANGGSGGGSGGTISFGGGDATGGTARVEVFGNGSLDISFEFAPSVTIGSIEGSGNVFLGANNLTVGSNNLSTTFSGVIQDGGQVGGTGGSLTKIGLGTLDLTGTNIYTGDSNINGGVLKVDGSITSNTFVNHDGTLAGTGTIHGNVTNNGGTVRPGDAPGTLTVAENYTQQSSGILLIDIVGHSPGQFSVLNVLGNASLNGALDPVLLNGFIPMIGQSFVFLDYSNLSGAFSSIENQVFDNGMEKWSVTYGSRDAILTAESTTSVPDCGSTLVLLTLSLLGLLTYRQKCQR